MSQMKRFVMVLAAALLPIFIAPAQDASDSKCLDCHSSRTTLNQGAHLYIDPAKYQLTTHARIGCVSCHDNVTKQHPTDGIRPSRAKCQDCHASVYADYNQNQHAKHAGCTDCHKPHAVKPLLAVSGRDINIQCAKCHENSQTVKSHSEWLPQAELHIDALPCITCHTGSENTVITLYMAKNVSARPFRGRHSGQLSKICGPSNGREKSRGIDRYRRRRPHFAQRIEKIQQKRPLWEVSAYWVP